MNDTSIDFVNAPNWVNSPYELNNEQNLRLDVLTTRVNDMAESIDTLNDEIQTLESKTYFDMLTVNDLEATSTNTTALNVAGECTTHDISADDINAINGSFSQSIETPSISCGDINATNDISCLGTISATSASTDLTNYIFSIVYPIGAILTLISPIYTITGVYRTTPTTSQDIRYSFRGCEFQFISDKRFLYNAGTEQIGSDYQESTSAPETGGEATHILTIDEMPSHNHQISQQSGLAGNNFNKEYFYPAGIDYDHDGSKYTYNIGGDQPHNNIPPFRRVYMYIRTA